MSFFEKNESIFKANLQFASIIKEFILNAAKVVDEMESKNDAKVCQYLLANINMSAKLLQ